MQKLLTNNLIECENFSHNFSRTGNILYTFLSYFLIEIDVEIEWKIKTYQEYVKYIKDNLFTRNSQ